MGNTAAAFDECACFNTRRAARQLAQAYDRALQPSGLTNTQFTTLATISSTEGDAAIELMIGELASRIGVERTTLTRNLKLMARDGLVRITPGADARCKHIELTEKGRAAFQLAVPLWRRVQAEVTASVDDWSQVRRDIAKLGEAAQAPG